AKAPRPPLAAHCVAPPARPAGAIRSVALQDTLESYVRIRTAKRRRRCASRIHSQVVSPAIVLSYTRYRGGAISLRDSGRNRIGSRPGGRKSVYIVLGKSLDVQNAASRRSPC